MMNLTLNILQPLQDLVLRFLKRAAGNLQQSFKVIVPSRKLHLNDRRRILAKQLADFVHIYSKVQWIRTIILSDLPWKVFETDGVIAFPYLLCSKVNLLYCKMFKINPAVAITQETDQLKRRNTIEQTHIKRPPQFTKNVGLDEDKFSKFVHVARYDNSIRCECVKVSLHYAKVTSLLDICSPHQRVTKIKEKKFTFKFAVPRCKWTL